jgi:hypothetical protein
MDIGQLAERFAVAHGRPPKSKYELNRGSSNTRRVLRVGF